MRQLAVTVLVAFLVAPAVAFAEGELTLKLAGLIDSNARRVDVASARAAAGLRGTAGGEARVPVGASGVFRADALAVGHVYPTETEYSSVGATAGASVDVRARDAGFVGAGADTRLRVEPARDCSASAEPCGPNQDYRLLRGVVRGGFESRAVRLTATASVRRFSYVPESDLSWWGPAGGLSVLAEPADGLRLGAGWEIGRRWYEGEQLRVDDSGVLTSTPDVHRADTAHDVSVAVRYARDRWSAALRYGLSIVASTSPGRSHVRHTFEPSLTAIPFGELLVRVSARLLRTDYRGDGRLDASWTLDDDARNRVSVVLEHPLVREVLFVEAGWAFHAQSIVSGVRTDSRVDSFARNAGHLGLTYRTRRPR